MQGTVGTFESTVTSSVSNAATTMSADFGTGLETMSSDATSYLTTISETFTTDWDAIGTAMQTAFDLACAAVIDLANDLQSDVKTIFTAISTDISSIQWAEVGKGIVTGVKSGIDGSWSVFSSQIRAKFSNLVKSIKSDLGIHSPSTVFAGIGEYMMEGLEVGLDAGEGSVRSTLSGIA